MGRMQRDKGAKVGREGEGLEEGFDMSYSAAGKI
jgi:hypothetical protein